MQHHLHDQSKLIGKNATPLDAPQDEYPLGDPQLEAPPILVGEHVALQVERADVAAVDDVVDDAVEADAEVDPSADTPADRPLTARVRGRHRLGS